MARYVNEQQLAQWYGVITERERQTILSSLCESDRRKAFQYGVTVSWHLLPDYAKDLVATEHHAVHSPPAQNARAVHATHI